MKKLNLTALGVAMILSVNTQANQVVYDRDQCIGPVIMGECHGEIIDDGRYNKTCYGEMLNGKCIGPMF